MPDNNEVSIEVLRLSINCEMIREVGTAETCKKCIAADIKKYIATRLNEANQEFNTSISNI